MKFYNFVHFHLFDIYAIPISFELVVRRLIYPHATCSQYHNSVLLHEAVPARSPSLRSDLLKKPREKLRTWNYRYDWQIGYWRPSLYIHWMSSCTLRIPYYTLYTITYTLTYIPYIIPYILYHI